jgi:hypothetical protein
LILPESWFHICNAHGVICLDYLNIIIYPLDDLLMHGRWDATVGVNPVPSEQ